MRISGEAIVSEALRAEEESKLYLPLRKVPFATQPIWNVRKNKHTAYQIIGMRWRRLHCGPHNLVNIINARRSCKAGTPRQDTFNAARLHQGQHERILAQINRAENAVHASKRHCRENAIVKRCNLARDRIFPTNFALCNSWNNSAKNPSNNFLQFKDGVS